MKKSEAILNLGLLTAFSAAAYLGILAYQQQQTQAALQADMSAQVASSERQVQSFERSAKQLEKQLAGLKGDLAAAKQRGAERETELSTLRDTYGELEKSAALTLRHLEFAEVLSKLPHYDTAAQVLSLPACTLTDAKNYTCSEGFKDSAGREFYLGGPGASWEVQGFINSLEEGKTYPLPGAFMDYQKKAVCKTAAQLLAIKPCAAAIVHLDQDLAVFESEDGKRFVVGGEEAAPDVKGFLNTLGERKSYSLPGAFIEYQKKPAPEAQPEPVSPPKSGKNDHF